MIENERFSIAFQRYFEGRMNEEERKALMEQIAASSDDELEKMMREKWLSFNQPDEDVTASKGAALLKAIFEGEEGGDKKPAIVRPSRSVRISRQWLVAASVLLIAGMAAYWLLDDKKKMEKNGTVQQLAIVAPGKDGAILTLADGSQVSLDSVQNATIALQDGVTARVTDGRLVYEGKGNEVEYNTISTPRGRKYHVTLPDGTEVWLNAASSIRYPTVFTGTERVVDVTGEAYFEVVKNAKMPFRAMVSNIAKVEVLGTHFNVNAYENEASINTTLLEGSVRVNGTTIKPGQQAQVATGLSAGDQTVSSQRVSVINDADVDNVMAWKNGFINFEGVGFDAIMRQLERWYDIEVVYENNIVPATRLAGKMTRGVSLNGLLKNLEALDVHYRLDGRKLIILQ